MGVPIGLLGLPLKAARRPSPLLREVPDATGGARRLAGRGGVGGLDRRPPRKGL